MGENATCKALRPAQARRSLTNIGCAERLQHSNLPVVRLVLSVVSMRRYYLLHPENLQNATAYILVFFIAFVYL